MKVSMLGTGIMGAGMAGQLLQKGFDVTVWNRNPARAAQLVSQGARLATSPARAAADADLVIAMLADDDASRTVWLGAEGALASMRRVGSEGLRGADLALVATQLGDPGNAGTLIRSAAAAGAGIIVLGRGSVDAYNPKVVRASAGACFAVRIVEGMVCAVCPTYWHSAASARGSARSARPPALVSCNAPLGGAREPLKGGEALLSRGEVRGRRPGSGSRSR